MMMLVVAAAAVVAQQLLPVTLVSLSLPAGYVRTDEINQSMTQLVWQEGATMEGANTDESRTVHN
jgi:hypothetical protein